MVGGIAEKLSQAEFFWRFKAPPVVGQVVILLLIPWTELPLAVHRTSAYLYPQKEDMMQQSGDQCTHLRNYLDVWEFEYWSGSLAATRAKNRNDNYELICLSSSPTGSHQIDCRCGLLTLTRDKHAAFLAVLILVIGSSLVQFAWLSEASHFPDWYCILFPREWIFEHLGWTTVLIQTLRTPKHEGIRSIKMLRGRHRVADITVSTPSGTEQRMVILPYRSPIYSFERRGHAYISAQNWGEYGSVSVEIVVDSSIVKEATSEGSAASSRRFIAHRSPTRLVACNPIRTKERLLE